MALSHNHSFLLSKLIQMQAAQQGARKFLRYVFHEIRVPLNGIILGTQMLKKETHSLKAETKDVINILCIDCFACS